MMSSRKQGGGNALRALAVLLCVMALAECSMASLVTVGGGTKGWTLGYNYNYWSSHTRARPFDNILFKYDPRLHNVLMVSKADFDMCRTSNPWVKYTSGRDYLKFTRPGNYYFICGIPKHCAAGMKVAINVRW